MKTRILYQYLINFILKKGNKVYYQTAINIALHKVMLKTKQQLNTILLALFSKLKSFVEVKFVKRRRRVYKVPFPVSLKRQYYLCIKWFFKAIEADRRQCSFSDKISFEFFNLLRAKKAPSVKLKEQNLKLATQCRSNSHYRW